MARRLIVARVGGDGFVVLLEGSCELNATGLAEQVQGQMGRAIRLAEHLGLEVIAEGIETPGQMAQMLTLGCDYGQGYLLSRPLTLGEAQAKVNHRFRMDAAA